MMKSSKSISLEGFLQSETNMLNNYKSIKLKKFIKKHINSGDTSTNIIDKIFPSINSLISNYGQILHPHINGYYVVYMQHGSWVNQSLKDNTKHLSYNSLNDLFQSANIDLSTNETNKINSSTFQKQYFALLATDIDLPEFTKEYMQVSSRNPGLTAYTRENHIPDFNVSFVEHGNSLILKYYDHWHKVIELYRKGLLSASSAKKNNHYITQTKYFYEVPYLNNIWVLNLNINLDMTALFLLPGVKPVSLPLKQYLGNRSQTKLTVYNIQHKLTNKLLFKFYDGFDDFIKDEGTLANYFKNFINNNTST